MSLIFPKVVKAGAQCQKLAVKADARKGAHGTPAGQDTLENEEISVATSCTSEDERALKSRRKARDSLVPSSRALDTLAQSNVGLCLREYTV